MRLPFRLRLRNNGGALPRPVGDLPRTDVGEAQYGRCMMKRLLLALTLVSVPALIPPAGAQTYDDQRRWEAAQARYDAETSLYQRERDRYMAARDRDRSYGRDRYGAP